ncbi:MAG: glycogen debranching enzyme family protein [Bacteroidales bacterium]|nr:glycogen debranching enzyme family protein [Bacteroidales bacterium]
MDIKTILESHEDLPQDIVRSNEVGAVGATTTIYCNTKCWHGLLSVYNPETKEQKVLLSNIDDVIITEDNTEYYLSTRKYPNVYFPLGHQYIRSMDFNPCTRIVYAVGGAMVSFECILAAREETVLMRYCLLSSQKSVKLQVRPLVAFRDAMKLIRMDRDFMTTVTPVHNGVAYHPRRNETELYMQSSKKCEFVCAPDWNYNIEYTQDRLDGKPYQEDLFMPGFFETELEPSEAVYFSFSTKNQNPEIFADFFESEYQTRNRRKTYADYLQFSADQMFREVDNEYQVLEKIPCRDYFSYHLFGALPGLTLPKGDLEKFMRVLKSYLRKMDNFSFGKIEKNNYDAQSPLWMIWALQQYTYHTGRHEAVAKTFLETINSLISAGITGKIPGLYTSSEGLMAMVKNDVKRYFVDINALWYNALLFVAELNNAAYDKNAAVMGDTEHSKLKEFADELAHYAKKVKVSFTTRFVSKSITFLPDSINDDGYKDLTCRPGQLLAFALPYSIADDNMAQDVIKAVEENLLTDLGLRSAPKNSPNYRKNGEGDIYPIYFGFLVEVYLKYCGEIEGLKKAERIYNLFNVQQRIETESPNFYERFAPEPPFRGKGSPLFAGTIATFYRIKLLIEQF